jgi:uridine kinase
MSDAPYLVGMAGASCSGKTVLATRLAESTPGGPATILALDSYYRDLSHLTPDQRAVWNFDVPEALDNALLLQHLRALLNGSPIDKPIYDFSTHTRAPETERVEPAPFIIIEGLFVLYWQEIRDTLGTKVFIAVPDEVCLARRIARDVRERGRTEESVRTQYEATVRPMYRKYCEPTARFADLRVSGDDPIDQIAETVLRHIAGPYPASRALSEGHQ